MKGEVILESRNLSVHFGGVIAVDNVDMLIWENELRCLIGPNGAGKSTFFKCLSGQLQPTRGQVILRDKDLRGLPTHSVARRGIGIKTQVPSLFEGLSVYRNCWLAARRIHSAAEANDRVVATLARLQLTAMAENPVNQLAHGQRQWVELGVVLSAEPSILLLDEPAAGMTHEEVVRTAALIREINRDTTLIVVDHDMAFVQMIASTVTVFDRGQVLIEAPVAEVLADPRVRDVYLGKRDQQP